MRNIWVIARREYHRFFATPIAYAIAFMILLVLGWLFEAILGQAVYAMGSWAPDSMPISSAFVFLLILCIPALTMRLISEESHQGTLELLLTAPVRDWELVIGKWAGGLFYVLTLIGITLVFPFFLNLYVTPGIDQRQMMAAYLGMILASAALIALGVGISAMFSNQIAAFFATLSLFAFLWWLVGFPATYMIKGAEIFSFLSFPNHYQTLSTGVIKLSDISYFLSLIALGLFAGTKSIQVRRWA